MTGMQIYKLLPRTNCKDCGVPTCLAFAMKLAAGKAELSECPHASEECRAALGAAAEPPVRAVKLGPGERVVGEETVLYRHQKRFFHPAVLALTLPAGLEEEELRARARRAAGWQLERVGREMAPEALHLPLEGGEDDLLRVRVTRQEAPGMIPVLTGSDPAPLARAVEALGEGARPVLGFVEGGDLDAWVELARGVGGTLLVRGRDLEDLAGLTGALAEKDFKDLVVALRSAEASPAAMLRENTRLRRGALEAEFKELGYPIANFLTGGRGPDELAFDATVALCRHSSLVVLPDAGEVPDAALSTLLLLRQHLYTDPAKPIQMEAKVYELGEPDAHTPVYVTTNFSLTYFLVAGELEAAGSPAYLVVLDTEGMGVLTAWAAGKFGGGTIAGFLDELGLAGRLESRRVVIPGYVAAIRGELEDALPDWEVVVGPQEAQDLPSFVKTRLAG